jgi:hypothetical protein
VFFGGAAPDAVPDRVFSGVAFYDQLGSVVDSAGDMNGDNDDTDEDGVIDLFDICPADFKPSQFDDDGDGIAVCGGDCGDSNADIHPGQVEECDGIDNDCNGLVDDVDQDGDGYSSCLDDCDDSNAAIHPKAVELCNGIDDNCNSLVDEDAKTRQRCRRAAGRVRKPRQRL